MTDTSYKFEVGKWYKTRNGSDAQILDNNFNGPHGAKIVGKVKYEDGFERARIWYGNGRWLKSEDTEYDLMPPVETKEFWGGRVPEWGDLHISIKIRCRQICLRRPHRPPENHHHGRQIRSGERGDMTQKKLGKTNGELIFEAAVRRYWAGIAIKTLIALALIKYVFWG